MSGFFEYKFKAISGTFTPYEKMPYTAEIPLKTAFTCCLEDPKGILWNVGITADEGFEATASVGVIEYMLAAIEAVGTVYSLIEDGVLGIDINVEERHDLTVAAYVQVNNRLITDVFIAADESFTIRIKSHAGLNVTVDINADEKLTVSMTGASIYFVQKIDVVGTSAITATLTPVTAINTKIDSVFTERFSAALWLYLPTITGASATDALKLTANAVLYKYMKLSDYGGSKLSELNARNLKAMCIAQI